MIPTKQLLVFILTRLALQQVHGLSCISRNVEIQIGRHTSVRGLTVTGSSAVSHKPTTGSPFCLLDAVAKLNKSAGAHSRVSDATDVIDQLTERTNDVALKA